MRALVLLHTLYLFVTASSVQAIQNTFDGDDTNTGNVGSGSTVLRGNDHKKRNLQGCASLPTNRYFKIISKNSNMEINVNFTSNDNGATIMQYPIEYGKNSNWRFEPVGSGYYTIVAQHSGKGVNVLNNGTDSGNVIVQWEAQGESDDWCFVDKGDGYYAIFNRGSGKVLAVPASSMQSGTQLIQWDFLNIPDQLWKIEPACAMLPPRQFFKIIASHSNMAMNVNFTSTDNGAQIVQFPIEQGKNSNWRFQPVGFGYYQIIAAHSGKGVNVLNDGKDDGNVIVQWEAQGESDDWCFVDRGNGHYNIVNSGSGKVLAVPVSSMEAGAQLIQLGFANVDDQLWKLAPVNVAELCLTRYGSAPTPNTCDIRSKIGSQSQLDNKPSDLLNTAVDNETAAMTETRLKGEVPMQDGSYLDAMYDPVYDAYCFNEDYPVPTMSTAQQTSLYMDYKTEFDRVLAFTTDVSEKNNRVTNDRIPGMFLRMCFHDNSVSVSQPDFQDYITNSIDPITQRWIGEVQYLNTSGADASNLICPQERFHPNQNYDQTASRVLRSIQRTLKVKYKYMSYADLLHNGCNAATIYLTGRDPFNSLKKNPFTFGRKDACYSDTKCTKKYPLCGPTELLPGVALSVPAVNDWFRLRGMSECLFMGLMWTHTTVDNMASLCPIKKLTCTATASDVAAFTNKAKLYFNATDRLDYFSFFLRRGTMQTLPDTGDDSDPNCIWRVNGRQIPWPMTGIDCTLGLSNVQKANVPALATAIMNLARTPAYNKGDILQCALRVLGGKGGVEGGACDLVVPTECKSPENHKFGGYYSTLPFTATPRSTIDPRCEVVGF